MEEDRVPSHNNYEILGFIFLTIYLFLLLITNIFHGELPDSVTFLLNILYLFYLHLIIPALGLIFAVIGFRRSRMSGIGSSIWSKVSITILVVIFLYLLLSYTGLILG